MQMSEADFHLLFIEYISHAHDMFMNIVSLLSGFLVASYLVAHRLNAVMTRVVIGIFTGAMLMLTTNLLFTWIDASGVADEIQKFDADWHIVGKIGSSAPLLFGIAYCVASILGYFAALVFFLNQRGAGGSD
jgi:hypothetical protein